MKDRKSSLRLVAKDRLLPLSASRCCQTSHNFMTEADSIATALPREQCRRIRILLLAVVVCAAVLMMGESAHALPRPENNCSDDTITYKFVNNSHGSWTTTEKNKFRDAMADWNGVKDYDGGKVVNSLSETTGSADVDVYFHPSPGGNSNSLASAECVWPQATISFNSVLEDDWSTSDWEHISRHEMGHLMGLEHTGDDDSFGGQTETMATCASHTSTSLSQDDVGNITHKKGDLSPETINANAGFEEGTTWWGKSSVQDFSHATGGAQDGSGYLTFRPSAAYGYVYQTMNYAASGGKKIDARVNHKKIVNWATTGNMKMEILVRSVEYKDGTCGSGWPTGKDQNHRDDVGSWTTVRTDTFTPSASWSWTTVGALYTIPSSWDAADIRIRVRSNLKYVQYGNYSTVAIDTTRARGRT